MGRTGRRPEGGENGPGIVFFEDAVQTVIAPGFGRQGSKGSEMILSASQTAGAIGPAAVAGRARSDAIRAEIRQVAVLLMGCRLGAFPACAPLA